MKSSLMQAILISLGSWLIFMSIDSMFLGVFTIVQKSHYNLFPDFISSVTILVCYLCIGISLGLISVMILFIKRKIYQAKQSDSFYVALSLSLAVNCMINIFSISNALGLPFKTVPTYIILFGFLLCGFIKITHYLKKSMLISLVSLCVSIELFWSIVRGFLKGGILFVLINPINMVYVFPLALFICSIVFIFIYLLVPYVIPKIKNRPVMLLLVFFITCLVFKDTLNSYSTSEHIDVCTNKPNILLIVMDTTRVDHLSCYGYHKKTTPHIDRYAQDAVIYKNAYSTASWTLPSMASILTGTYPGYHGAHRVETSETYFPMNKLNDKNTTLAELLKQAGYNTAGIVGCEFLTKVFGLHQGFNYFDDKISSYLFTLSTFAVLQCSNHFFPLIDYLSSKGYYGYRVADQINKSALSWLEENGKKEPFFLFLHYFDPHHPYWPEELGTAQRNIPDKIRGKYKKGNVNYVDMERGIIDSVMRGEKPLLPDEKDYLLNNYNREISILDKKIGAIFKKLEDMSLYDNTLIIITADHGESFGEHNLMLHGVHLYDDNIHVPLIIKYPLRDKQKGFIDYPVSLVGIVPTILSHLSIEPPDFIQGSPFNQRHEQRIIAQNYFDPNFKKQKWAKRFMYDLISIKVGDYKYIKVLNGEDQLFNLKEDQKETDNIIKKGEGIKNNIRNLLDLYTKQLKLAEKSNGKVVIDKKTMQNLKALGYIN